MTRTARCCCGALQVEAEGDPVAVVACHCRECQRRTGSVFGVGAYYDKEKIRASGPERVYVRGGQEGRKLRMHFCPTCGTTVYWDADLRPNMIGVAVGAFGDTEFPAPNRSIWERSRHGWVAFAHDLQHFETGTAARPPQG